MGRLGVLAAGLVALLAACSSTRFEPPQVQGPVGLVQADSGRQLWVLQKQEEVREVRSGRGGRRNSVSSLRKDTFFHFDVQAFDPVNVQPLWKQRIVTYQDDEVAPGQVQPSRIVGSSVSGRLLGQDGSLVWLLVGSDPYALDAETGAIVHDPEGLQRLRPELAGLLPSESRLWGFDQGPVITLADARVVRLSGRDLQVRDHLPREPSSPALPAKANGMPDVAPLRPMTPVVRHKVQSEAAWLALYTDDEAADAVDDSFGDHARFPYSIDDDGSLARRTFRRIRLAPTQRFEETFLRIVEQAPVPDSPVLLRGRFVRDPVTDAPVQLDNEDLLVWHRSRIDDAGRLLLTRFGPDLVARWQTELPLTDGGADLPVHAWLLDGHLVVHGVAQRFDDEVRSREPHLVSVSLQDGTLSAWNLSTEVAADP
ncbi:PA2928 family protein [Arenimonas donghaensis]|uniref:Uncharacterized protein n=1 Tax=Arenimonas donghaensis DSM 18148 = HO3-R19 TaxID=1121014 RepID=A0A087MLI0_9GAMM|nr:PA2928 family protein [Arenimonas donghaensis]KFL37733.1 hypothetical protein N788_00760 [Arenimonas donghaensis DSM 18148 = HO3-R19]